MIKMYGKKKVEFKFIFNENGEELKTIVDKSLKKELYNKKLLLGEFHDRK